jgi:ATP-binding cassette, subfamily B, bacterial
LAINKKYLKTDLANIVQVTRFVYQSDKHLFVLRLVLIVLQSILPLVSLYVLKLLVDAVTGAISGKGAIPVSDIWLYAGAFSGVFLFTRVLSIINQWTDEILTQRLIDFISNLLHKKSTELDLAYYDNAEYHDTFHRAQQETNYRPIQMLDNLTGILQNSLSLVGIVALLFTFSWLGIVIMLVAGLPSLGVKLVRSKVLYNWLKKNTQLFRKVNYFSMLMTNRAYAKEVRVFNLAGHFQKQFKKLREQLVKQIKNIVSQRTKYDLISVVIEAAALLAIIYLLGAKAYAGTITLGSFVMFFEAFRRGQGFVQTLVGNVSKLYENKLFLTNLFEFLDLESQIYSVSKPVPFPKQIKQGIRFENISFKYPGSEKWVLQNYNLTAKPGQVTTIEGENGAGKTTLVKLLCRLYEWNEGQITIDGIDIRQFDIEELRKNISVLFQDFAQYDLTAGENISLGNTYAPADEHKIQKAANLGCAALVIDKLPNAYDTLLGKYFERGEELSMGQWQRVALTRAIYKDAQILVLDEPSSWLDAEVTNAIKQNLSRLLKGRIVLLISHAMKQKKETKKSDSTIESYINN